MVLVTLLAILCAGAAGCPSGSLSWSSSPICASYCPALHQAFDGVCTATDSSHVVLFRRESTAEPTLPYQVMDLAMAPSHGFELWARFREPSSGCLVQKGALRVCVDADGALELWVGSQQRLRGGTVPQWTAERLAYELRLEAGDTTVEVQIGEETVTQATFPGFVFTDDASIPLLFSGNFSGELIESSLLSRSRESRRLLPCVSTCSHCTREGACIRSCTSSQYWDGACLPCLSVCASGCVRGSDCVLRSDVLSSPSNHSLCVDYAEKKTGTCACVTGAVFNPNANTGVPTCACDTAHGYSADTTSNKCVISGYFLASTDVSATFSSDFLAAIFTFTRAVSAPNACGDIFVSDTYAKLGNSPACTWSSDSKKLNVTFDVGATLTNTDYAVFNATNVRAKQLTGDTPTKVTSVVNFYTQVGFPTTKPAPKAVIIAPEQYSIICGDLILSGEVSSGNFGRELLYSWSIGGSAAFPLTNPLTSGSEKRAIVKVPQSWLRPGTVTVTLTVSNFFGEKDTATKTVIISGGAVLPVIIEGGDVLTSHRSREVRVKASVNSKCAAGRSLSYRWEFSSATPYTPSQVDFKAILEAQTEAQYLVIPPKTLLANFTYWFIAYVVDEDDNSVTGNKRFQLNMPWDNLVIVFDKAAGGTFYQGSGLAVSASDTYDPDDVAKDLVFSWRCTVPETGKPCQSAKTADTLLVPQPTTGNKLTIAAADLLGSANYTLTLNVSQIVSWQSYPYRTAEQSLIMRSQNTSGPIPKMVQFPTRPIGARSVQLLQATVESGSTVTYTWAQVSGPAVTPLTVGSSSFYLARDWTPGYSYTFSVSASTDTTTALVLNVNIEVSKAPSAGSLVVSPNSARELTDLLWIQAHNWVDVDGNYPISYEFRYATASAVRSLGSASPATNMETWLPAVATSVQAVICDNLGSCATVSRSVTLQSLSAAEKSTLPLISDFSASAVDTERIPGLISRICDSVTITPAAYASFFSALSRYYSSASTKSEAVVNTVIGTALSVLSNKPADSSAERQALYAFVELVASGAEERLTDSQLANFHYMIDAVTTNATVADAAATYREMDSVLTAVGHASSRFQLPNEPPKTILTSLVQAYYARQLASAVLGTTVSLNTAQVSLPADLFAGIEELQDTSAVVDLFVTECPSYSTADRVFSSIVTVKIEYVGTFKGVAVTVSEKARELTFQTLTTPIRIRIPRSTPTYQSSDASFLVKFDCVYLTERQKWSPAGCSIDTMSTDYINVVSTHASIFAVQDKAVTVAIINPTPMSNSPGVQSQCDHCGTILTPIWFNIVIFLLAVVLAVYGVAKDKVDRRKAGDYDFSALRTKADQEKMDENLRNRILTVDPWFHTFCEGHLLFGSFWYYRPELSRWARFLIVGTSLIAEECILGVLYWKVKDQPDSVCDRAIYEIYHSMGPTDAFLVFVSVITWTPFTILLVLLFHHLKTFSNSTLYSARVTLACVLIFVFVGLGTAGVVEVAMEMCGATSVAWTFSFIYLMIGEVFVTHSAIALMRLFLIRCSQTAYRNPVD